MEDDNFDGEIPNEFQSDSDDLKKKAAAQSSRSADASPEDQSRGALHYGEDQEGNTKGAKTDNAAFEPLNVIDPNEAIPEDAAAPTSDTPRSAATDRPFSLGLTESGAPEDEEAGRPQRREPRESNDASRGNSAENAPERPDFTDEASLPGNRPAEPVSLAFRGQQAGERIEPDTDNVAPASRPEPQNQAPEQIELSSQAVAENAEGAVLGVLSVSDKDKGDNHSFTVSDDRFEIVDGQVKLKDGISLNHEESAALTLEVTATDGGGKSFTQSFDITVTDVNEAITGMTLSNHAIAENAAGAVVGTLSVSDLDHGDSHSFSVSDDRFEVVDGQVKLKDGISLDHEEAKALTLDVTATDSGGNSYAQSFDLSVVDMPDVSIGSGFHARYFDMNQTLREIDDVDWDMSPTHQEIIGDINYKNGSGSFWEGGAKDTFGVQITGNIDVQEGGVFNFHIGGDDGVVLFVDGKEVVENDGLHSYRNRSGEVELDPGTHVIEVRYFENYGHAGLKVEWEGPGIDGRELLTPPEAGEMSTVNGMPLTLDLETEVSDLPDGAMSQIIEGLPPGTKVETGDAVLEVGEDGTADITGWDSSMLHITPPVDFTGTVDAQVITQVTLEGGDAASTVTPLIFDVDQAEISPPSLNMQSGFRASYFDVDHSLSRLDQIDWDADPTKEEVIGEVNYRNSSQSFWEGGAEDTFGVRITGEITVDEAGEFDFFLGGDDGVVLFVNGVEVIDNDGLHSYRTRSGEIELEPGTHEIEIRYFENYGHAGLKLEWEGPGTGGRQLVQADTGLAVEENGAINVSFGTSDLSPDGVVMVSGLPEDTILVSGDQSIVVDGTETDLSGWDLDMVEVMPPPGFEGIISAEVTISDTAYNGQTVETTEVFAIEVGDVSQGQQNDDGDQAMLMAHSEESSETDHGWTDDGNEHADGDSDESREDVMDEPVEDTHGAEQSYEMAETYERSDW